MAKPSSYFVRMKLPEISGTQRELFSQLLVRLASNFSFLGLEDWSVDLPSHVKVLGIEREFHDLTKKGKQNAEACAYFAKRSDAKAYGQLLAKAFADLKVSGPHAQAPKDWMKVWRKHYKPVSFSEAGTSLAIVPAWQKRPAKIAVRIFPGQAFGTGTHPTTRLCLRLFLRRRGQLPNNFSLLDFGSGTGILALSALTLAKAEKKKIKALAVESDPDALDQSRKNAKINGVKCGYGKTIPGGRRFDLVFANVLSPVLLQEKKTLANALKPRGLLLLSGILAVDGKKFIREFSQPGLKVAEELREEDWISFALVKA